MSTPTHRMSEYFRDNEIQSTVTYAKYCVERIFKPGFVVVQHRGTTPNSEVEMGLALSLNNEAFIVRFNVPLDSTGAMVKLVCMEACEALRELLRKRGMRAK